MASYMPPLHVPLETKWKHWPTYIYDKNYGYGINYYQPMLDHIDREGRPSSLPRYRTRSEPPELPWSDGRLLWEDKPVEPYSRHELIKRAIDAEDEARDHLTHFKVRIEEIGERKSGQSRERGKAVRRLHDYLTFSSAKFGATKGAVPIWTLFVRKRMPREAVVGFWTDLCRSNVRTNSRGKS